MRLPRQGLQLIAVLLAAMVAAPGRQARTREVTIRASAWRVIESESGPVNYYRVVEENGTSFVRARYRPPLKTAVLGWQAEGDQRRATGLRFSWRAQKLPAQGNECRSDKSDSAAVIYVTWKRGLRYYTVKYTWSATQKKGTICARKRNPFVAQDLVVLESGPPLGTWRSAALNLPAEYRKHFADGDAQAEVPDFVGVGIMTDGDQTQSESAADYGTFTVAF